MAHDEKTDDSKPQNTAPRSGPTLVMLAVALFVLTLCMHAGGLLIWRNADLAANVHVPVFYILTSVCALLYFFSTVLALMGTIRWAMFGTETPTLMGDSSRTVELLATVSDRMLISDQAKRIAYREQDRNALRRAIREDIDKGDFEAGLVLAHQMSEVYGYKEEAEEFRDEILLAREADVQRKVTESINNLDQMLANHQWHRALLEAGKIQRLYPDSPKSLGLEDYVRKAFDKYKNSLVDQFKEAHDRDDVELAMDLMKELDRYLTEADAAPLRAMARNVIAKKRDNLSVQFRMAVQEKQWAAAHRIGRQIMEQFPNSKMSAEVAGKIEDLRQLALQQQTTNV